MSQEKNYILHLGTPTPGDPYYFTRWNRVGTVFDKCVDGAGKINVIVTDQYRSISDLDLIGFPNVRYICSATTGHTHLTFTNPNIKIISLKGEDDLLRSISSTCEHTIYFLLQLARRNIYAPLKLRGKSIGIIGLGRVGKQVQMACRGLGMTVYTFDKRNDPDFLDILFERCDFITIHLDENPTTRGMINNRLIWKMKPTAFFINTSRASIVDEESLFIALKNNLIAGAALDVSEFSEAYFNVPNLIKTPHVAGRAIEDRMITDEFIVEKLTRTILKDFVDELRGDMEGNSGKQLSGI